MTTTRQTRADLHQLVDELPDAELHTARRFLSYLRDIARDPVRRALLDAPYDDEPETPEEAEAVAEAYEAIERGEVYSHEDVRRELGR